MTELGGIWEGSVWIFWSTSPAEQAHLDQVSQAHVPLAFGYDHGWTLHNLSKRVKLLPFGSVISCVVALWCGGAKQRGKVLPSVTSLEGGLSAERMPLCISHLCNKNPTPYSEFDCRFLLSQS